MLDHMGWNEAGQCLENAIAKAIKNKEVTYDFARVMDVESLATSEFAERVIAHM